MGLQDFYLSECGLQLYGQDVGMLKDDEIILQHEKSSAVVVHVLMIRNTHA